MIKNSLLFQTLLLSLLPFYINKFNYSLSFSADKSIKVSQISEKPYRIKTVVIDAGHGGHDPGCLGKDSKEKDLALNISKNLAADMQVMFPDIKVLLTRSTDVFIPLYERAAIANRNNADLFISIHCNAMPKGHAYVNGTETYVMGLHTAEHNLRVAKRENASILLEADYEKNYDYDPNSAEGHILLSMFQNAYLDQSISFAEKVEMNFKTAASRKSRGVKQAGFVVLKETTMPSVLIEAGFLSNKTEENYLRTTEGQKAIANGILNAFRIYKNEIEQQEDLPMVASRPSLVVKSPILPTPEPETQNKVPETQNKFPESSKVIVYKEPKIIPIRQGTPPPQATQRTYNAPPQAPQKPKQSISYNPHIRFCVQLAASPGSIDTNNEKWRNLGYLVEIIREDRMYKYQARNFLSIADAEHARSVLKSKGFTDAFIVAYKNGHRIPVEKAKSEIGLR